MLDIAIGVIGDSAVPQLALVNSNIASQFLFFYTTEMESNAKLFKNHLQSKSADIDIEMVNLPSIGEPSQIVVAIKKYIHSLQPNQRIGVFLTAGAKQTILPFVVHLNPLITISLRYGSPYLLSIKENGEKIVQHPTSTSLEEILAVRGWHINSEGFLVSHNKSTMANINPSFNEENGRLRFWCESAQLTDSFEFEDKKKIIEYDQNLIGDLIRLSESFGRNGATYSIQGKIKKRNRNVLPYFISNDKPKVVRS